MESAPESNALEARAEARAEEWRQAPVVLASGSSYRRERMEQAGYSEVTLADPIPENVETDQAEQFKQTDGAPETHWDSDGANMAEHIAAAKVRYVLDNQAVSPEHLVVGFDTLPVIYETSTENKQMGVPSSHEKYSSYEAAVAGVLEQFKLLAAGCEEYQERMDYFENSLRQHHWPPEEKDIVMQTFSGGLRRGHIYITCGVAVSAPFDHDAIYRFTDEVRLFSHTIHENRTNEVVLQELAEQAVTLMAERALGVSGGIDYADEEIRELLQIEENQPFMPPADPALYAGFAPAALKVAIGMAAYHYEHRREQTGEDTI